MAAAGPSWRGSGRTRWACSERGGSGGCEVLAGVTFTPKALACGVDLTGPSHRFTRLDSMPPCWASFQQPFHRRMGHPHTEAGRQRLTERSPVNFADRIERPLPVGQGANDPRFKGRDSDPMVQAMAARHTR